MEVKEDYKTFSRIERKIPKTKWNADKRAGIYNLLEMGLVLWYYKL